MRLAYIWEKDVLVVFVGSGKPIRFPVDLIPARDFSLVNNGYGPIFFRFPVQFTEQFQNTVTRSISCEDFTVAFG